MAERVLGKDEAAGSVPAGGSMLTWRSWQHVTLPRWGRGFARPAPLHAVVAQLAERDVANVEVAGS